MRGLARVNLILGKNNAGKTSLLEAVRLLVSGGTAPGSPAVEAVLIALERGEVLDQKETRHRDGWFVEADLSGLFYGRQHEPGAAFSISSGREGRTCRATISQPARDGKVDAFGSQLIPLHVGQAILPAEYSHPHPLGLLYRSVNTNPALSFIREVKGSNERTPNYGTEEYARVVNLSGHSLRTEAMATFWADGVHEGREDAVPEAMRIIDPRVRDVFFVQKDRLGLSPSEGVLLGMKGRKRRVPLGSAGDGVRRMLAISLALSYARRGYLLVDEIDTGLHHSVLAGMWKLVIAAARQNDVQVFATTHSKDCLEALAEAVETTEQGPLESPIEQPAVFQVDAGHPEALRFDASELRYALDTDLEIRGR